MKYKIFIGIDISKEMFDAACLLHSTPKEIHCKFFLNDQEGFKKFEDWILSFHKIKEEGLICFEDTGLYSKLFADYLHANQWNYRLESGLQIKLSAGINRLKSDRSDAVMILNYIYLRRYEIELTSPVEKEIQLLKVYLNHREKLDKVKKQFQATLNEYDHVYENDLHEYVNNDSEAFIKKLELQITRIETKIKRVINSHSGLLKLYKLLITVPGIKFYCAIYMIMYTKGFTTHLNYRKFASYCGIAPFEYTSGKSVYKKARVHRLGNKKMKSILRMPALVMSTRGDNEFSRYYQRKTAEGKHHLAVLNAVKNKLISRAFAVVRRGTPYRIFDKKIIRES